jgi:hypothetical protein
LTEIRGRCDRIGEKLGRYEAFGSGWELSYAIDLPALLAEVDRLRAQLAAYRPIADADVIPTPHEHKYAIGLGGPMKCTEPGCTATYQPGAPSTEFRDQLWN